MPSSFLLAHEAKIVRTNLTKGLEELTKDWFPVLQQRIEAVY